jgi:type VII secretion-associated protein (TIGR03931 family)
MKVRSSATIERLSNHQAVDCSSLGVANNLCKSLGVQVTSAVVEFGPVVVRRLSPGPVCAADPQLVQTVLAGIDDSLVLYEDKPTEVDGLLRVVLGELVDGECHSLAVLVPSDWWESRIERLLESARTLADRVVVMRRARFLAECNVAGTIFEAGLDRIIISKDGAVVQVVSRPSIGEHGLPEHDGLTPAYMDFPTDVASGAERAELAMHIARTGARTAFVGMDEAVLHWCEPHSADGVAMWRTVAARVVALIVVGSAIVGGIEFGSSEPGQPMGVERAVELVEGRVAVRVPSGWRIERILAGPGSNRVQVTSPGMFAPDPNGLALHITQTQNFSLRPDLSAVAEALWQLIATDPDAAFTAFTGRDNRYGRPTVTYREVRESRVVRWNIVVDRFTRIGIGCQSSLGREADVDAVCGIAVRSAHVVPETPITGTT